MNEATGGLDQQSQVSRGHGSGEPGFRHCVSIVRRRLWVILAALVILGTIGAVHAYRATPIYQATAKLLIERQTPRIIKFDDLAQLPGSEEDYYKTQQELVKSRAVLDKALEQPGIRDLPEVALAAPSRPSALDRAWGTLVALAGSAPTAPAEPSERLRQCVTVEQLKGTHLLLIKVDSANPKRAALLANAVGRAFEQHHVERKLEITSDAFRFLREQKDKQEQELLASEDALQKFREAAQVVSLDVADKDNPILLRLHRLNTQLTEIELQRVQREAEFAVVEQALEASGKAPQPDGELLFSLPAVRTDPTLGELRSAVMAAEKEAAGLAGIYGPEHPQAQAAQAHVEMIRARLRAALTQLTGSLASQLATLKGQERALAERYKEENQRALDLAKKSLAFNRLHNEVERHRGLFEVLLHRMREVDLTADYAKTNVALVEEADAPRTPYRPNKAHTVLAAVLMGLLLGVGLAFFAEHLDDTIKTPEEMEERVGVAVLGFVPDMDDAHIEGNGIAHRGLITLLEPSSSVSEAYRTIRTSLFFSAPAEETKALVVTSGSAGDGKTTTACNLAQVIAQSGKRVLLIDADLRRPMVRKIFGLEGEAGLSTVLVGEARLADAVQQIEKDGETVENLDVLTAGPTPPNPAELLDSMAMRGLLTEARQQYDRVIIDTPPVLFVADASILGALSDGVILVVKSAANKGSLAARAREQLESVNARILGGVLNDVYISRLDYYYSRYYYYGYSRYCRDYRKSYYSGSEEQAA